MTPGAELQQESEPNLPETAPRSSPERRVHPAVADAAYGSNSSPAHGWGRDPLVSPSPALSPPVNHKQKRTRVSFNVTGSSVT